MKHLCRHCRAPLSSEVLDLGEQPPSNAYLTADQLGQPEVKYPDATACVHKLLARSVADLHRA